MCADAGRGGEWRWIRGRSATVGAHHSIMGQACGQFFACNSNGSGFMARGIYQNDPETQLHPLDVSPCSINRVCTVLLGVFN